MSLPIAVRMLAGAPRPSTWLLDAMKHAQREAPRESCGLCVLVNGLETYFPIRNVHPEHLNAAQMNQEDVQAAASKGRVIRMVHSHSPGDTLEPSQQDIDQAAFWRLPSTIVDPRTGQALHFMADPA
jgi:proteasome lid subunit RPN8/RPN11